MSFPPAVLVRKELYGAHSKAKAATVRQFAGQR